MHSPTFVEQWRSESGEGQTSGYNRSRLFLVVACLAFLGEAVGITHESTKHLKDTLLQDYDSLVPPIPSDGKPVSVKLGPVVMSFRRDDLKGEAIWHFWMDSVSSDTFTSLTKVHPPGGFGIRWNLNALPPVEAMLTWLKRHPGEHPPAREKRMRTARWISIGWDVHLVSNPPPFYLKWNDERLAWEPSDHSNISELSLPSDKVWIPDITPYNEVSEDEFDSSLHQQRSSHAVVHSNGEVHFVPNLVFRTYCEGDLTHWPLDRQVCGIKFGSWVYDGNHVNLSLEGSPEDALDLSSFRESTHWTVVGTPIMTRNEIYYSCCPEPYIDLLANITFSRKPSLFYHTALFFPTIMTFMRIMMCLQVIGLIWSLLTLLIASTHNGVTSKLAQLSQTALGKVFCLFTEMPKELTEGEGNGTSAWTEILVSNFLDRLCFYTFLCTIAFNFAVNWPHRQLKILEMTTRDVLDLVVDTSSRNSLKTKILFARFISDIRESSGPDKLGLDGPQPDAPD
ncbi:unnamed protein product [Darwinula stevensoni]|uniref:Neurotransmitter-gated ion-channel ligand-binding domain-containing protein n=1 Tax=Darwinula stevensoni TaxID=69355 RepID=A0A7R8X3R1_9CRUS|nr:unnamed protein product [Darwinula stevensoni]CAG0884635.1 unnamed protein product [Darwinula stevensoni]